jgi:hypothetical protein
MINTYNFICQFKKITTLKKRSMHLFKHTKFIKRTQEEYMGWASFPETKRLLLPYLALLLSLVIHHVRKKIPFKSVSVPLSMDDVIITVAKHFLLSNAQ